MFFVRIFFCLVWVSSGCTKFRSASSSRSVGGVLRENRAGLDSGKREVIVFSVEGEGAQAAIVRKICFTEPKMSNTVPEQCNDFVIKLSLEAFKSAFLDTTYAIHFNAGSTLPEETVAAMDIRLAEYDVVISNLTDRLNSATESSETPKNPKAFLQAALARASSQKSETAKARLRVLAQIEAFRIEHLSPQDLYEDVMKLMHASSLVRTSLMKEQGVESWDIAMRYVNLSFERAMNQPPLSISVNHGKVEELSEYFIKLAEELPMDSFLNVGKIELDFSTTPSFQKAYPTISSFLITFGHEMNPPKARLKAGNALPMSPRGQDSVDSGVAQILESSDVEILERMSKNSEPACRFSFHSDSSGNTEGRKNDKKKIPSLLGTYSYDWSLEGSEAGILLSRTLVGNVTALERISISCGFLGGLQFVSVPRTLRSPGQALVYAELMNEKIKLAENKPLVEASFLAADFISLMNSFSNPDNGNSGLRFAAKFDSEVSR